MKDVLFCRYSRFVCYAVRKATSVKRAFGLLFVIAYLCCCIYMYIYIYIYMYIRIYVYVYVYVYTYIYVHGYVCGSNCT